MICAQAGALLVTASAAGLLTQVGSLPYSVTKHASVGLAEWLAITYKSKGIGVSCLCPQAVATGMLPTGGDGGPAGGDGVLTPEQVACESVDALAKGLFLVLPPQGCREVRPAQGDGPRAVAAGDDPNARRLR